jgi:RNA polymerase sigma-70 factor (ECF subfamily)
LTTELSREKESPPERESTALCQPADQLGRVRQPREAKAIRKSQNLFEPRNVAGTTLHMSWSVSLSSTNGVRGGIDVTPDAAGFDGENVTDDNSSRQPALSDERLCDALAAGEPWAGDALYDRVEDIVAPVLFQLLGPDHEQDDLIQQAMEKVISTVVSGRFGRRCSLRKWAQLITQNVAFDALRKRARERRVLDRTVVPGTVELVVTTSDGAPELAVDTSRRMENLRAALAAIKRERAEAVLLHDVLGHELTEIARLTGVSIAAAQSRLVRGRKDVVKRMRSAESQGKAKRSGRRWALDR